MEKPKREMPPFDTKRNELIAYGLNAFNGEAAKFQRWLQKLNASLGDRTPESLLQT